MHRARFFSTLPRYGVLAVTVLVSLHVVAVPSMAAFPGGTGRIAVIASAVDAAGRPVADLSKSDFNVQLETGGATVMNVALVAPTQVIVLLDLSDNAVRSPQRTKWNSQCVEAIASHLPGGPSTNLVVLGYSDSVRPIYNGPVDAGRVAAALASVGKGGGAATLEVLKFMGETIAQQGMGDRTVLVIVTDGIDTLSRAASKDVVRSLGLAGVPLFSVMVLDPAWNGSSSKLNAKTKLQDISKATGGTTHLLSPGDIDNAAGLIASMMAGRYRIEIDPGVALKGGEARLTVGARREGVALFHADHLYGR